METHEFSVGIVGLGLMGCSIATCLLIAGHRVVAIAPIDSDLENAERRIKEHLISSKEHALLNEPIIDIEKRLNITNRYEALASCKIVIECTIEDQEIKKVVIGKIESAVSEDSILASNTSAIPISILQTFCRKPDRFFGLHWTEPAHTTRFLEIICGEKSNPILADFLYELAHRWKKEPILVRKDIEGFITNRLMYAMFREAIYLVENGYASVSDIDRSCRNNAGYYMTFVGVFRWMDLTGVLAYHNVMKNLLPTLCNNKEVPKLIDDIVRKGGKGVANSKGFYEYEPGEAAMWEETFKQFTYEIRELALRYPEDVVKKKLKPLKENGI